MSGERFKLRWQVEDGYVGGDRPQITSVFLDEFEEDMDVAAIKEQLEQQVQSSFDARISWCCENLDEVAKQIHAALSGGGK